MFAILCGDLSLLQNEKTNSDDISLDCLAKTLLKARTIILFAVLFEKEKTFDLKD